MNVVVVVTVVNRQFEFEYGCNYHAAASGRSTNKYVCDVWISYSGYDLMKLEQLGDTRIMVYNGHREISLALVGR